MSDSSLKPTPHSVAPTSTTKQILGWGAVGLEHGAARLFLPCILSATPGDRLGSEFHVFVFSHSLLL